MNSFTIFIITMLLSLSISAQANDFEIKTTNLLHSDTTVVKDAYSAIQTEILLKQFHDFALDNIQYPNHLVDYGLEGTVLVAISICKKGKIVNMRIVKSFSSYFNDSVLNQLQGLKSLDILNKPYDGHPIVYLPIKFSLR